MTSRGAAESAFTCLKRSLSDRPDSKPGLNATPRNEKIALSVFPCRSQAIP
jgi:hypothetical protein